MVLTMGKVTYSHDLLLAALQSSTVSYKVVLEPGSIQIFWPMLNSTGFLSSPSSRIDCCVREHGPFRLICILGVTCLPLDRRKSCLLSFTKS